MDLPIMITMLNRNIRVAHAMELFLAVSENWIYPQVNNTPGTQPRIYCRRTENQAIFPLKNSWICTDPPDWSRNYNAARIINAVASRAGCARGYAYWQFKLWRPDLMHAHFGTFGWQMLGLKEMLGIPLVTSFYGFDAWLEPKRNPAWIERYSELFRQGDLFLVEGPAMRDRLITIGCPPDKIRIHRLGVNIGNLPFRERIFSGCLRVIMLARFVEKKGLLDGLAACARAAGLGANLSVTIVGDAAPDDHVGQEIKKGLQEMASRPPLAGRVKFTGFITPDQSRDLLNQHDIYLCPSKFSNLGDGEGGSPVGLTEAMALGLLCIGTRHCDIPQVIHSDETGILCESGDVEGLSKALLKVFQKPGYPVELTRLGRQHVENQFSVTTQANERLAIYQSLIQ
jgi:colanic acid/amylovoran biosynthesis glycosyltransferase